jgi:hypothetical protein
VNGQEYVWKDWSCLRACNGFSVIVRDSTGERRLLIDGSKERDNYEIIEHGLASLDDSERETLLGLAPDWHGTILELIEAAKNLA